MRRAVARFGLAVMLASLLSVLLGSVAASPVPVFLGMVGAACGHLLTVVLEI